MKKTIAAKARNTASPLPSATTMPTPSHTPGKLMLGFFGGTIIDEAQTRLVATTNREDFCDNEITDSRLADAAELVRRWNCHEELLSALRECLPVLAAAKCECNDDRDCQSCHANRKARAAIARATGGE